MTERVPLARSNEIANDWTLAFAHYLTQEASAYWERCRGERSMPMAKDLKPREMKRYLPNLKLVSVIPRPSSGYDFRVRLVGDGTRRVFGSISNKSLDEFLSPAVEKRWRLAFEAVCARRTRERNHGNLTFEGKEWLDYEVLVAPLGDGDRLTDLFVVFLSWPRGEAAPQPA